MERRIKWIVALMIVSTTVAIATITVDFGGNSEFAVAKRLRVVGHLVLDFTINASGQVILDASVSESNMKNVVMAVNGWDGVIGTVTDYSLFNSSFALSAEGFKRNGQGDVYTHSDVTIAIGDRYGYLGVYGLDCSVIDGASTANNEMLSWTLTSSTPGLEVAMTSFQWTGKEERRRNVLLFDHDTSNSWYMQSSDGVMSISDYVIGHGESITFSIPEDAIIGYGLSGYTLEVARSSQVVSLKSTMIGLLIN